MWKKRRFVWNLKKKNLAWKISRENFTSVKKVKKKYEEEEKKNQKFPDNRGENDVTISTELTLQRIQSGKWVCPSQSVKLMLHTATIAQHIIMEIGSLRNLENQCRARWGDEWSQQIDL